MNRRPLVISFTVLLFLIGCLGPPRLVQPGMYVDPTGEEHLTIAGTSIALHIRVRADEPDSFLTATYDLWLGEEGNMHFRGVADTQYFLGVGRFVWYWDGQDIIRRTDAKTGVVTEFTRLDPRT